MPTIHGLNARLAKLETASHKETLVVLIRQFQGELMGIRCTAPVAYFTREKGESEEALTERAIAEAETWGGMVVLNEERV